MMTFPVCHWSAPSGGGGGSVSLRSSAYTVAGFSPCTITKPAGTVAGDILIACISSFGSGSALLPPSGWTALQSGTWDGGNGYYWVGYLVAGASEPSSYSWTDAGFGETINGTIVCLESATTIGPSTGSTGNSATVTATGATATAGSYGVLMMDYFGFGSLSSAPTGWTDLQPGGATRYQVYGQSGLSGATGSITETLSTGSQWVAALVLVEP